MLLLLLYVGLSTLVIGVHYCQLQHQVDSSSIVMLVIVTLVAALLTPLYMLNRYD